MLVYSNNRLILNSFGRCMSLPPSLYCHFPKNPYNYFFPCLRSFLNCINNVCLKQLSYAVSVLHYVTLTSISSLWAVVSLSKKLVWNIKTQKVWYIFYCLWTLAFLSHASTSFSCRFATSVLLLLAVSTSFGIIFVSSIGGSLQYTLPEILKIFFYHASCSFYSSLPIVLLLGLPLASTSSLGLRLTYTSYFLLI